MKKSQEQQIIESIRDIKEGSKLPLIESSLSRLWDLFTHEEPFAVLTAHVHGDVRVGNKENKERQRVLQAKIREMGYGFIPLQGGYRYEDSDVTVEEDSLLIPQITYEEALVLAEADWMPEELRTSKIPNGQEAFVHAGKGTKIKLYETAGDVLESWERGFERKNFDGDLVKGIFSQLRKANAQHRKKWAFSEKNVTGFLLREFRHCSILDIYVFRKRGLGLPTKERWITVMKTGVL